MIIANKVTSLLLEEIRRAKPFNNNSSIKHFRKYAKDVLGKKGPDKARQQTGGA
jgi:hypothetical protein